MLGNGHYFDFRYPDFFAYLDTQTKAVQIIEVALYLIPWKIKGVLSGSVTVPFTSKFTTSFAVVLSVVAIVSITLNVYMWKYILAVTVLML